MTVPPVPADFPAAAVYALAAEFMRAAQAAATRVNFGPDRSHEVLPTPAILCAACAAELYLKCALLGLASHPAEALESLDLAGLYGLLPHTQQSAVQSALSLSATQLVEQLGRIGSTRDLWRSLSFVADGAVDAAFVKRFAWAAQSVAAEVLQ